MTFLQKKEGKLVEVCPADSPIDNYTGSPREKRSRKDGPRNCWGYAGGQ